MMKTSFPVAGRVALTLVVVVAFVLTLAGTSKKDPDELDSNLPNVPLAPPPSIPPSTPPAEQAAIPPTVGWTEVRVEPAGVVVKIPPNARLDPAEAGNDTSLAGRYFHVHMPSGYDLYFAQRSGEPIDLAEMRRWYSEDAIGFEGIVFEAADALVAHRREGPAGEYWEATACSGAIEGLPLCTQSAGATIGTDDSVTKMTNDEVLEVVAIARSIRAVP